MADKPRTRLFLRNRKGYIQEQMNFVIGVIIAVVVIAVFYQLYNSLMPYEQINIVNAKKLQLAIKESCASGNPVQIDNFQLVQPLPTIANYIAPLAGMYVRNDGDPRY